MATARRLRVLAAGLNGGASSSPSAAQITEDGSSITELDAPALLSDADVKQFLVRGPSLSPPAFLIPLASG